MVTVWNALLSSWDAWLLTFALAVGVPALGYLRFRRLRLQGARAYSGRAKLALYGKIIGRQWLLLAAMLLVLRRHGLSIGDVGERVGDARLTVGVTAVILTIVAVVFAIGRWRVGRAPIRVVAAPEESARLLAPAWGREMAVFALVSLTAGICEELLYRGWLVNILHAATGSVWVAVGVATVIFGLGHAYQGAKGILRTTFIGLQLALLFVYTNSLIPGQALHAAINLVVASLMATAAASRAKATPAP
jgi:membrane protease YdiL (CAAX protease family)